MTGRLPDFIIGGAPRSGTTWLATTLDRHPAIWMAKPLRPEPKFFLVEELYAEGLDQYSARWFAEAPDDTVVGEKSTNYLESGSAARRIAADLPGVRMIFLLRDTGLINNWLVKLGVDPIAMLYTPFAVMAGLVYGFLPFMVLPIYASLEKLDLSLLEAAEVLGARPTERFRRVTLPLSMPGVVAGCLLVFIPALGSFLTSDLLGGAKQMMIGNLVQNQFSAARNWPFGSAASFIVMALVLAAVMLYLKVKDREQAKAT